MSGAEKIAACISLAGFVGVLGYLIKMELRLTRLHRAIAELENNLPHTPVERTTSPIPTGAPVEEARAALETEQLPQ
jgi:hypothetical protein